MCNCTWLSCFKYHFENNNGIINLNRQRILVYSFIITETRVVFKKDVDAINFILSTTMSCKEHAFLFHLPSCMLCFHQLRCLHHSFGQEMCKIELRPCYTIGHLYEINTKLYKQVIIAIRFSLVSALV